LARHSRHQPDRSRRGARRLHLEAPDPAQPPGIRIRKRRRVRPRIAENVVMPDLRSRLNHTPKPLGFGTSGRRGLIADLTQIEIYINVTAELEYLLSLSPEDGGITRNDDFYYALDLRPSSPVLMEAVAQAIEDAGMRGLSLGQIPTPALMHYALSQGKASIMITGS